jgi:Ca2+:H+ antiporter
MLFIYVVELVYSFTASNRAHPAVHVPSEPRWTLARAGIVLLAATGFIVWSSEVLVGMVEHVVTRLGWTEFFLGIVIIPIVGNVAEHLVAVQMAAKDRMQLSLEISLGSSLQIALFVAPVLVYISLLVGHPMDLVFNQFELIALTAAAMIAALVALDGESNWMEGAQLLVVYVILAMAFFFLPA